MRFPVIDLFAGPGGLGEGFTAFSRPDGYRTFTIRLSVEKDLFAHRTLELRSFFHSFKEGAVPDDYYQYLMGSISRDDLFRNHRSQALQARKRAWCAELGAVDPQIVDSRIRVALSGRKDWVLVGGPPCQAYSTAGRSRRKQEDRKIFEKDDRHFLYREYLRILQEHRPPVFIMENVKGLLSSTIGGERLFSKILDDLAGEDVYAKYKIYSFVKHAEGHSLKPADYIIRAEDHGVPQSRHRLILLGIRSDLSQSHNILQSEGISPTVRDAISDLPDLRSKLSREEDSPGLWLDVLQDAQRVLTSSADDACRSDECPLHSIILRPIESTGNDRFSSSERSTCPSAWIQRQHNWFIDPRLKGVCNHSSRAHMRSDLLRYFFASTYAAAHNESPRLKDFPESLLPDHRNVKAAMSHDNFSDRFRVQLADQAATTIMSHMAKDGHYYIHYDPAQCRSLTVREAARLQTFPDNYFFEGPRTEQYRQVGNAVPPMLARKLAGIVYEIMRENFPRSRARTDGGI